MNKKVAIIVINWNSFEHTNNCILSLKEMAYTNYDIILVDNASKDGSGEQLQHLYCKEIIFIQSPDNLGFTGGNNLGLVYAINKGYPYSLLLNNDTYVEKDFIEILVNYMDEHAMTGVIQPKIFFNHDRNVLWNGGSYFNLFLGITYTKGYFQKSRKISGSIMKVDWVTGCAFFVRNTVLKQSGLLAENMFIYYEDVDLSFRIRKLGYNLVFHPESVIYHIAGMSNKNKVKGKEGYLNPIVHYLNERNRIWFLKKYTPPLLIPSVFIFNFFYTIAIMGYFVVRLRPQKLKAVLKAVKDGMTGHIIYK